MAPVITIDGPTASGKGTIAQQLANELGWNYLDSGALYRLVGLKAVRAGADPVDRCSAHSPTCSSAGCCSR